MKRLTCYDKGRVLTSLHMEMLDDVYWDHISSRENLKDIEGLLLINPGVTKNHDIHSIEGRLKDNPNAKIYITLTPKVPDYKLKQKLESKYKNVTVLNITEENSKEMFDNLRRIISEEAA